MLGQLSYYFIFAIKQVFAITQNIIKYVTLKYKVPKCHKNGVNRTTRYFVLKMLISKPRTTEPFRSKTTCICTCFQYTNVNSLQSVSSLTKCSLNTTKYRFRPEAERHTFVQAERHRSIQVFDEALLCFVQLRTPTIFSKAKWLEDFSFLGKQRTDKAIDKNQHNPPHKTTPSQKKTTKTTIKL